MKKNNFKTTRNRLIGAVAGVAAVFTLSVGAWANYSVYAYVSLDVNPSITYSVNRFHKVLDVTAMNQDGAEIIADLDLKNQDVFTAVSETVSQLKDSGYFDGDQPGGIVLTAYTIDEEATEDFVEDLEDSLDDDIASEDIETEVEVEGIGRERVLKAQAMGVSPGKLNLVEKLQATLPEGEQLDLEEWLNKPVREIMKTIKENKKNNAPQPPSDQPADEDVDVDQPADEDTDSSEDADNDLPNEEDVENTPVELYSERKPQGASNANSNKPQTPASSNGNKPQTPASSNANKPSSIAGGKDKETPVNSNKPSNLLLQIFCNSRFLA